MFSWSARSSDHDLIHFLPNERTIKEHERRAKEKTKTKLIKGTHKEDAREIKENQRTNVAKTRNRKEKGRKKPAGLAARRKCEANIKRHQTKAARFGRQIQQLKDAAMQKLGRNKIERKNNGRFSRKLVS